MLYLNVQSQTAESSTDAVVLSDPVADLEPKVQKDVLVFINLVDFCKYVSIILNKQCDPVVRVLILQIGNSLLSESVRVQFFQHFLAKK